MANEQIKQKDIRQAGTLIQVICGIGLVIIVIYSISEKATVSPFVYAILGGGILGTDNILRLLKSVFRLGGNGE